LNQGLVFVRCVTNCATEYAIYVAVLNHVTGGCTVVWFCPIVGWGRSCCSRLPVATPFDDEDDDADDYRQQNEYADDDADDGGDTQSTRR